MAGFGIGLGFGQFSPGGGLASGEDTIESKPGGLPATEEHGDLTDLTGKKYYFRTHDNKNWRYVDLMKALQGVKGIQTIPLEVPADYPDVTATAK